MNAAFVALSLLTDCSYKQLGRIQETEAWKEWCFS